MKNILYYYSENLIEIINNLIIYIIGFLITYKVSKNLIIKTSPSRYIFKDIIEKTKIFLDKNEQLLLTDNDNINIDLSINEIKDFQKYYNISSNKQFLNKKEHNLINYIDIFYKHILNYKYVYNLNFNYLEETKNNFCIEIENQNTYEDLTNNYIIVILNKLNHHQLYNMTKNDNTIINISNVLDFYHNRGIYRNNNIIDFKNNNTLKIDYILSYFIKYINDFKIILDENINNYYEMAEQKIFYKDIIIKNLSEYKIALHNFINFKETYKKDKINNLNKIKNNKIYKKIKL